MPLLVVEDDPGLQSQLRWSFEGYEVLVAEDRKQAIAALRRHEPPVVTLDLGLPPDPANASEGLRTLDEILHLAPHTKVIVVTGNDDRSNALKAIAAGAYDFYQKPVDPEMLGLIVARAARLAELEAENRRLAQAERSPLEGIVGASPQMLQVSRMVEKVAPSEVTTLILGESGTGKELIARALHDLSPRREGPFVAINCAAIPGDLLESELFGHEKGAFTGAAKQTRGKVEYAEGGTLFLDEIGDMPLALQAKMLRFLQERVIERIGGRRPIPVDTRIVCATHQDLKALMGERSFREDLYYRISELVIELPPLREREGDRLLLARSFLERFGAHNGRSFTGFTEDAVAAIEAHPWPGNVRELENTVRRAVVMAEGKRITAEALGLSVAEASAPLNLRQVREQAESAALHQALALYANNISRAAEALGVSRPTVYDLMKKYGL